MSNLEKAFGGDKNLLRRIDTDSARTGDTTLRLRPLFEDIAQFYLKSLGPSDTHDGGTGPAAKKRKLENGSLPVQNQPHAENAKVVFELKDVSFSIPQRKKFHFQIKQSSDSDCYLYITNTATSDTEYTISTSNVTHVLRLLVPEKAQKQFNYIFLPKVESGLDPILFTVPAGPAIENLDAGLKSAGLGVTEPSPAEFASAIPEAHRKNEKAYHVKAFRGSKDGFLFFLSTGIFFGFKKPLFFVGLEDLQSVAYTSVLQRTFNIVITYKENNIDEEKEIEFSMLDQADYAGINDYVQRHGLNDASLAEARKAKMIGKDKNRQAATNGDANDEDDGRTELEKAEAQLQDEEDENEEDFELDSDEADSEGSGESDDEYDEEGDQVKEELGSEAEDVSDEEGEDEEVDDEEEEEEEEEEVVEEPKPPKQTVVVPSRSANEPDPEDDDQL